MTGRRRARHRKADADLVAAELSDPRQAQERAMYDARRRAIVGDGADPILAGYPLGVMYARRIRGPGTIRFGEDHKASAEWFIHLYRYRNGPCTPKGTLDIGVHGGAAEYPKRDAEFRALMSDRRMRNVQVLVCPLVHDIFPRWLLEIVAANQEPLAIARDQAVFMATIDVLREIWVEFGGKSEQALRDKAPAADVPSVIRTPSRYQ